jgi:hypothetical protein
MSSGGIGEWLSRRLSALLGGGATTTTPGRATGSSGGTAPAAGAGTTDFTGSAQVEYAPRPDGRPDPGEIVWTWVSFEEHDGRGKDRPVLLIARLEPDVLGLMLSSKDHNRDAAAQARHGRYWIDIGSGSWDPQGRPSEVRIDRVLRINPKYVRREGAILEKAKFAAVANEVRRVKGW